MSHQVFVLWDVMFEEGLPHCTLLIMGEQISLFDTLNKETISENTQKLTTDDESIANEISTTVDKSTTSLDANNYQSASGVTSSSGSNDPEDHVYTSVIPPTLPHQSNQVPQPLSTFIESQDYQQ